MKGKPIKIICVGKLKSPFWKNAYNYYYKLLIHSRNLECIEIKDSLPNLTNERRIQEEGENILNKFDTNTFIIGLHEKGDLLTSCDLAEKLEKLDMSAHKKIIFIIGGPFGLSQQVLKKCNYVLSLSPFTWPHELARVLLLEQLYRVQSIMDHFPYHH